MMFSLLGGLDRRGFWFSEGLASPELTLPDAHGLAGGCVPECQLAGCITRLSCLSPPPAPPRPALSLATSQ